MNKMGTLLSLEGQEREELDEHNETENQCTGEIHQEASSGNSSEESALSWSLAEEIAKLKEPGQFVPASMVHSHLMRMQKNDSGKINCCRLIQAFNLAVKKGILIKAGSSLYSINNQNLPKEIVERLRKVSGGEDCQEGFSGWGQGRNLARNNMECLEWYLIRRGNGYGIYDENNEEPPKDCLACEKKKKEMAQMRNKKDMKRKRSGNCQSEKKTTKKMKKYCNCIEPNNMKKNSLKKRGKRSIKRGRSRGRKKTPVTCMAPLLDQQPIEDEDNEEKGDDENEQGSELNTDNDDKESQEEESYSDEEENIS